jgi:hypothetical protein
MVLCLLILGLSALSPPTGAATVAFTNNGSYQYTNGGYVGLLTREAFSPIAVNQGVAITRVDVAIQVSANLNGNDVCDIDVYVRHPDGTEQQLAWSSNIPIGGFLQTTYTDIFRFNDKLASGTWFLRVRDDNNYGSWNTVGGAITSWTLTLHYNEPVLLGRAGHQGQLPGQRLGGGSRHRACRALP